MIEESPHVGSHLLREVSGLSRDEGQLTEGALYLAATVLGKITKTDQFIQWDPTGDDGRQIAVAILYHEVDTREHQKPCVVNARLTAVRASSLIWPESITLAQKTQAIEQLNTQFIVLR